MSKSMKKLLAGLEDRGISARATGLDALKTVANDIKILLREGFLDQYIYKDYLANYTYLPPDDFPEACSILIAAVPSPPIKVTFHWKSEVVETVVPPTYADANKVDELVLHTIWGSLAPGQARFERIYFPYKTLAARTGLILYGRNNIGYVPGRGSYHRLTAFLTDMEAEDGPLGEKRPLPACATCRKCLDACPNRVIREDRFIIEAKRCLTFQNEQPSDRPFPEWVGKDAHNALIGCMICQRVCPYDREVAGQLEEGEVFTEEETELLLSEHHQGPSSTEVERKLTKLGLDLSIFPRNLDLLLQRR